MPKRRVLRAAPLFLRKRPRLLSPESGEEKDGRNQESDFSGHTSRCTRGISEVASSLLSPNEGKTGARLAPPEPCPDHLPGSPRPTPPDQNIELDRCSEAWLAMALGHTSIADPSSDLTPLETLDGKVTHVSSGVVDSGLRPEK